MLTITLLFALTLGLDGGESAPGKLRMDGSTLKASLKVVSPWCRGRPRVQLTLQNVSQRALWLDLERSPKEPIEWLHYSYFPEEGGGESSGGVEDGDFLAFLRSGESARLDPGKSGTWVLKLGRQNLHVGRATVGIEGPVIGTTNLDDDHTTFYDFQAEISVKLNRLGQCYSAGAANKALNATIGRGRPLAR